MASNSQAVPEVNNRRLREAGGVGVLEACMLRILPHLVPAAP